MSDLARALLAETRNSGRDDIERIFEERVAALKAGVELAVSESLNRARQDISQRLNQSVRHLVGSHNQDQWSKTLADATAGFCDRAALFMLESGSLVFKAARNISGAPPSVALDSAPAFRTAAESRDAVIALRTKGEMSETLAQWAGELDGGKFHLFPISIKNRVIALLYADSADGIVDANALELLATIAAAALALKPAVEAAPDLVNILAVPLSPENQARSLKAQRFARSQAAEIRLYKSENVKNGRAGHNLYASLKKEIDSARETFRRDFLSSGTTLDYLHQELVHTLANDDVELLGPDYPGPLV